MSLKWTRKAAADLDAIYDHYVVLIGPEKALKAVQDIVEQVKPLQQVANRGRAAQRGARRTHPDPGALAVQRPVSG